MGEWVPLLKATSLFSSGMILTKFSCWQESFFAFIAVKNVASVRQFAENTAMDPLLSEPHAGSRVATTRTMINFRPVEVPVSDNSSSRIIRFSTFEVNLHAGELRQHYQNPDHLDISC